MAKPPGRFVNVEGIRVHYIARGKGRPVVLIHGNGTMAEDFLVCGLVDQLAKRYRVIAIDRPGFGHTGRPRHCVWTPAAQAHLVDRTLARLKVVRPLVVGHSWGTLVALALAGKSSHDLRGLVLLSGYYFREKRVDLALSTPLAIPGFGDAVRSAIPRAVHQLMAQQAFRHVFSPQPVPARFKARFPVETALGEAQLRASAEDTAILDAASAGLGPSYPTLGLPVAILAGDADAVVDTETQSRRLHQELSNSTLKVLAGQGHMIHYSAKRDIGRAIDGLMDGAPGLLGRTRSPVV